MLLPHAVTRINNHPQTSYDFSVYKRSASDYSLHSTRRKTSNRTKEHGKMSLPEKQKAQRNGSKISSQTFPWSFVANISSSTVVWKFFGDFLFKIFELVLFQAKTTRSYGSTYQAQQTWLITSAQKPDQIQLPTHLAVSIFSMTRSRLSDEKKWMTCVHCSNLRIHDQHSSKMVW